MNEEDDAPRTSKLILDIVKNPRSVEGELTLALVAHSEQLELELAHVKQELENRDALSIHSCHANCQRPMCKLRRELAEARAVADDWRNKALYWRTGQSPATVSYIYAFPWETHLNPDAQPQIPHP